MHDPSITPPPNTRALFPSGSYNTHKQITRRPLLFLLLVLGSLLPAPAAKHCGWLPWLYYNNTNDFKNKIKTTLRLLMSHTTHTLRSCSPTSTTTTTPPPSLCRGGGGRREFPVELVAARDGHEGVDREEVVVHGRDDEGVAGPDDAGGRHGCVAVLKGVWGGICGWMSVRGWWVQANGMTHVCVYVCARPIKSINHSARAVGRQM